MTKGVQVASRKRTQWLAGIAVAALVATAAHAQPNYQISLSANGLEPALLALASQTNQQIFFHKGLVAGLRAPEVRGSLTPDEAVRRLLAGTDLRARRVSDQLIVVERVARAPGTTSTSMEGRNTRPFLAAPGASNDADPLGRANDDNVASPARVADPTTVDEVTVTGSNIRGAPTASALLVLDREALARAGQTTIADTLKALPQNFAGGATDSTASTGADRVGRNNAFGTGLNLRGLGNNATLVLVNGRRVAGSGSFGDFADVSTLPSVAVDRVEVLLDGASALYGSDAVGGVVNIILRKDYQGAETRVLAGTGLRGEPREGQISQTFGWRWDGGGALIAYEARQREALNGGDRAFTATSDLGSLGGTDQRVVNAFPGNVLLTNPITGVNAPAFAIPAGQSGVGLRPGDFLPGVVNLQNNRLGFDITPKQTTQSVYLSAHHAATERLQLSADARYGFRRYRLQLTHPVSTLTLTRGNPFYVSPIGAATQSIAYSFADLPFARQTGSAETLNLTAGADLDLAQDWRAQGYVAFGQEIDENRTGGVLQSTALSEALGTTPDRPDTPFSPVRDGFYNPLAGVVGSNGPAVLAFIGSGFTTNRSRNRVASVNLQADGPLFALPGGRAQLALGAHARRETFVRGGANFVTGVAPTPIAATDVARNVTAAFVELRAPLVGPENPRPGVEVLELSLAGRVEHYEAVGTTTNPKLGLLWGPAPDVRMRATYGRSFRAPALRELQDPAAYAPSLLALGTARIRTLQLGGGNPELKPETATTWTVGFDITPESLPGLTLGATLFDVRFRDRIDRPVIANILGALSDPNLAPFVQRISPATNAADLARITALLASPALTTIAGVFPPEAYGAIVETRYVNTATLRVRGLDVIGSYRFDLGDDRIVLAANATYMFDYKQRTTPTSAVIERVGVANFPVAFRGRATADWTRDRLTLGAAVNYTSAYRDPAGVRIDDHPTLDLQARLTPASNGPWRGVTLSLTVRNVFDRDPPFYNNPFGVGYDPANGDPLGRYAFIQLSRAW